eukprot:2743823-Pleurochrysis_carterae.AAC.2
MTASQPPAHHEVSNPDDHSSYLERLMCEELRLRACCLCRSLLLVTPMLSCLLPTNGTSDTIGTSSTDGASAIKSSRATTIRAPPPSAAPALVHTSARRGFR